jgi:hypothetical protein
MNAGANAAAVIHLEVNAMLRGIFTIGAREANTVSGGVLSAAAAAK